jgi:hypothetical protein
MNEPINEWTYEWMKWNHEQTRKDLNIIVAVFGMIGLGVRVGGEGGELHVRRDWPEDDEEKTAEGC